MGREALMAEVRRGVALLADLLAAPQDLVGLRTSGRLSAAHAEVSRMLERTHATVVLVGQRSSYDLLDVWLGQPVLAGARTASAGPEPLITLRGGAVLAYRGRTRAGQVHEGQEPGPTERSGEVESTGVLGWLRRLWLRIRTFLSRAPALPPARSVLYELHALLEADGADRCEDLLISSPTATLGRGTVVVDARTTVGADASQLPPDTDVCLFVLEDVERVDPSLRELASSVARSFPHLIVAAPGEVPREELAAALGVDVPRLCVYAAAEGELSALAVNERALGASARCAAAIRIAVAAIDDVIARDADVDRRALSLLTALRVEDAATWRSHALERVAAGCAGRTVRLLESTASVLEKQIARVEAACVEAVDSATSRQEIQERVAEVDASLRSMRDAVEAHALALAEQACADLLPDLCAELDARVDAVAARASRALPRPEWPPAPRFDAAQPLLASETLARDDLLRVEPRWSDAVLMRSLDKIKDRSGVELGEQLQRLGRAAWSEILRSEPQVAQTLLATLGDWLDQAIERLSSWIDGAIDLEREGREAARERKHVASLAERERLVTCATRLASEGRLVSTLSQRLCSPRSPAHP